jgi:hypothetical protein
MACNKLQALIAAVAVACLTACGPATETSSGITPEYDKQSGRLSKLAHDSNGNGKPDTVAVMDGNRVVRVEADEDENGTVDRWEYYTSSSQATSGQAPDVLERVERATRRDGQINRWEFFDSGKLVRVNEDTDGNGKVDKWEQYADGTLTEIALDTTGRGTPDRKLIYSSDGNFDHIEVDKDGSGHFEPLKP